MNPIDNQFKRGCALNCYAPMPFRKRAVVELVNESDGEHGHANHLGNEMASVAYWYAARPAAAVAVPPVGKRRPVLKADGRWVIPDDLRWPGQDVRINDKVLREARSAWKAFEVARPMYRKPEGHSPFLGGGWLVSRLMPAADVAKAGRKPIFPS